MRVGAAMRARRAQISGPAPERGGSRMMRPGRSRWRMAVRRKSRVVDWMAWRLGSLVEARAVKASSAISTAVT